jgi:hypothetical protein
MKAETMMSSLVGVRWSLIQHNIKYYSEFYATCFGFFALQEVTYLLAYFAQQ